MPALASLSLLLLVQAPPETPEPPRLPDPVRAMIEAAIATGDGKATETVIRLARQTNPNALAEIDRLEELWRGQLARRDANQAQERKEKLAEAGLFDNWKGQAELGASRATGSSRNFGVYGALGLDREGLNWRHKLTARADIQETNQVTTTERVLASYQPNYKFGERLYTYGIAQYEYDPIQGYDGRYTLGGGLGYGVLRGERAKLDFEGGPTLRHLDPIDRREQTGLAARASLNLALQLSPDLEVKQTSAFYYEQGDTSASALTTLDARLFGPLKARFSYDLRYETGGASARAEQLNTVSRATLVYSF